MSRLLDPGIVRPVPTMDINATKDRLVNCAKSNHGHCDNCKYLHTRDCKSRLMLEASHALVLLLEERELGAPLRVEEDQL